MRELPMVDFALQRLNMVESQVRPSELLDRRVADAMLSVDRQAFLPEALHSVAYSDGELALDVSSSGLDGVRQVLAPRSIAQMLQAMELESDHVVLVVGGGCGYEVALASTIAQTIVAVESEDEWVQWSERVLTEQNVSNAVVVGGPLGAGYANEGPYDAILINGCVDDVPESLLDQLKDGGRLVAGRRRDGVCRIVCWNRVGEQFPTTESASIATVMLPGFVRAPEFVFS